jgi:hypothetical protein
LQREISTLLVHAFPSTLLSQCWERGVFLALDPCPLDESTLTKVYPTIFTLHFVFPTTVEHQQVADVIAAATSSKPLSWPITFKASAKDSSSSELLTLDTLVGFAESPLGLYPLIARPTSASYVLTVTFPFTCPDDVRDAMLQTLASRILNRIVSTSECDSIFTASFVPVTTERVGIPRITNSFRAQFGFYKDSDAVSQHIFTTLCTIHLEHKMKLLDTNTDRTARVSNASFSFFTDKNPKQRQPPPAWLHDSVESLRIARPELFATKTHLANSDTDSASSPAQQHATRLRQPLTRDQQQKLHETATHLRHQETEGQPQQQQQQQQELEAHLLHHQHPQPHQQEVEERLQRQPLLQLQQQQQHQHQEAEKQLQQQHQQQLGTAAPKATAVTATTAAATATATSATRYTGAAAAATAAVTTATAATATTATVPLGTHEQPMQHQQGQHQQPFQHQHRQQQQRQQEQQPMADAPKIVATHSYSLHLQSDANFDRHITISFCLDDYGQYMTHPDTKRPVGNACMILCLSACLKISPELLLTYFSLRRDMLLLDSELYAKQTELQQEWEAFCSGYPHLLSSFPPPLLNPASCEWAGGWRLGQVFEASHLNLLAPLEVRECPILVIQDNSAFNQLTLDIASLSNHVIYLPPAGDSNPRPPIILRNKGNHFTVLRPAERNVTTHSVLQILLPLLQPSNFHHYIKGVSSAQHPITDLLNVSKQVADTDELRHTHGLLHMLLSQRFPRTISQTMAYHYEQSSALQALDAAAADAATVDILSPPLSPPRNRPDTTDGQSPTKAAALSTPPRSSAGLERTARNPAGFSSASASPRSESSLAIDSETDLGQLVEMTGGRTDSRFAARIGVRGDASSDETSISGSFHSSGLATGSTSETPSIFSTGSFHPHPIPNGAIRPPCAARHAMQFGNFSQPNHRCDNPACNSDIPQGIFGWHCEMCSFDYCSTCFPYDWTAIPSQESTLHDSLSTLQLYSESPSPLAALRHQEGASAAVLDRGHND